MDQESLAMQLIVHAGHAKSLAMKAIQCARNGDAAAASEKLEESSSAMTQAHAYQTEALQASAEEPEAGVSMLMAHAQDHLMNALTIQTLAQDVIALYGRVDALTNLVKGE